MRVEQEVIMTMKYTDIPHQDGHQKDINNLQNQELIMILDCERHIASLQILTQVKYSSKCKSKALDVIFPLLKHV